MTTENKKTFIMVVAFFTVVSFLVLGSILHEFNFIDLFYLIFVIITLIRYIHLKLSGE